VPRALFDEARQVTIPLHVLLQWDDEGNDRRVALELFDASPQRRRRCTPTWAGTPASRSSRGTPRTGSLSGT
jgi:hypothetical protein